jgi:hypothetical protein
VVHRRDPVERFDAEGFSGHASGPLGSAAVVPRSGEMKGELIRVLAEALGLTTQ